MSTATPALGRRVVLVGLAGVALALVLVGAVVLVVADATGGLLSALALGSVAALVLSWSVLVLGSQLVVQPVDDVVAAMTRVREGARADRLHPDRPMTELGRVAEAFDEVLASLDAGLQVAAKLERRSGTFETRWRQVLEAASEAYVALDPRGVVVDVNRRAVDLLGVPREELCGRSVGELVSEQDRDELVGTVTSIAAQGVLPQGGPYEIRAVARDGRRFPAECTVWAVDRRGGTVVHTFVRDISERRQAHEANERLAAVIEGSYDAIVTEDLTGTIRTWNKAAERSFGWPASEAVGEGVGLIVPAEELAGHRKRVARIVEGEQVLPFEGERLTRGGLPMAVSVRLSPVYDAEGALVGVSSLVRDITEQRWMAETLDASLVALQEAVDEARASEEVTRRFLDDAAHQLRTPVAGISACAETLLRGVSPEDADRLLASMVRETSRAARLISGLLHMARLDRGVPIRPEPVDVVDLCADEVERICLLAPQLSVDLEVVRAPAGPLLLDPSSCQEILSNLGDNARRHAACRVVIRVDCRESGLRVAVCDDGPGVPEQARENIFHRFVSLDGGGGSGLGLPIAQGLARSMGGDLRYDSEFVLELPATAADALSTSSTSTLLSDRGSSSGSTA